MFADPESEDQIGQLRLGRRPLRHHPQLLWQNAAGIARLHQKPAGDAAESHSWSGGIGQSARQQ